VQFRELAEFYGRLGATTKRLELRAILAELIQHAQKEELPRVVYLSQGMLRPEFEGVELGVAGSLATAAVAAAMGTPAAEVTRRTKETGDLGTTAEQLRAATDARTGSPLTLDEVYESLEKIAAAAGAGSQEIKVQTLAELLKRASAIEAKYLVRLVLGTLRVGIREMTILDALAVAFAGGGKEARAQIEGAFNLSSDLGLVAERLAASGVEGLAKVRLQVGRPIRPMLAERAETLAELLKRMEGTAAFEYKYDGLRVQAHVPAKGPVRLFSRRLEEISEQFPELVQDLPKALRRRPAIVEGECVVIDPQTDEIRPFQEVSRRRGRKYDLDRAVEEIPVSLYLFDVLLDGDAEVLHEDFPARRAALVEIVKPTDRIRLAEQKVVHTVEEATEFFERAVAVGGEGIMAKSVAAGSAYRAGARGFWWIKYKRDYTEGIADSIDGVVVGGFAGRGRRAGRYGAFLLATYNPQKDRFETFCKVGSGFDDAQLAAMPPLLDKWKVDTKPDSVETTLEPDQWFEPKVVLEVKGAELTLSPIHRAGVDAIKPGAGLALRFPRFTGRIRDEKSATQATTSAELVELFQSQKRTSASESDGDAS
jgi:DNA ligase 1